MRYLRYYGMTLRHQYGGKTYNLQQVSRRTAKKAYDEGKMVFLQSCNMNWGNMWQHPCPISRDTSYNIGNSFESVVADYIYYNCDSERGKYPNYFIET